MLHLNHNKVFSANINLLETSLRFLEYDKKITLDDNKYFAITPGIRFQDNTIENNIVYYLNGTFLSLYNSSYLDGQVLHKGFSRLDISVDTEDLFKIIYTIGYIKNFGEFNFGMRFLRDRVPGFYNDCKDAETINEYSLSLTYKKYIDLLKIRSLNADFLFSYIDVTSLSSPIKGDVIYVLEPAHCLEISCGLTGELVTKESFDAYYKVNLNYQRVKKDLAPPLNSSFYLEENSRINGLLWDLTLFLDNNWGNINACYELASDYKQISSICSIYLGSNKLNLFAGYKYYDKSKNIKGNIEKEYKIEIEIPFPKTKNTNNIDFTKKQGMVRQGYSIKHSIPIMSSLNSMTFNFDPIQIYRKKFQETKNMKNTGVNGAEIQTFSCNSSKFIDLNNNEFERLKDLPVFGHLELDSRSDSGRNKTDNRTNEETIIVRWSKVKRVKGFYLYIKDLTNGGVKMVHLQPKNLRNDGKQLIYEFALPDITGNTKKKDYSIRVGAYNSGNKKITKVTNQIDIEYINHFLIKTYKPYRPKLVALCYKKQVYSEPSANGKSLKHYHLVSWIDYEVKIDVDTPTTDQELYNLNSIQIKFSKKFKREHLDSWYQNDGIRIENIFYDKENKKIVLKFRELKKAKSQIQVGVSKLVDTLNFVYQLDYNISNRGSSEPITDIIGNKANMLDINFHTHTINRVTIENLNMYKNNGDVAVHEEF